MSPARATKLRFTLWTAAALMAAIGDRPSTDSTYAMASQ